jgi:hypothetical protein
VLAAVAVAVEKERIMERFNSRMPYRAVARQAGLELLRQGRAAALALALVAPAVLASEQQRFASPEEAAEAFGNAVLTSDEDAMKAMLGPDMRRYIPPVDQEITLRFIQAWAKSHRVVAGGDDKALIEVGGDGWTMPIPIVKAGASWRFDVKAGAEEMRVRRIGRNERAARQVVLAIFDAQREYAAQDADGDGLLEYAPKLASAPGKKDGLYWLTGPGEEPSPLGELIAEARAKGSVRGGGYHGYRYRILTAQGAHAQGGAFDYRVKGHMIGGFAVVAWPVTYGETGVMTFMVNHDGVVYEKDLGPKTADRVRAMQRFDPDNSWKAEGDPS